MFTGLMNVGNRCVPCVISWVRTMMTMNPTKIDNGVRFSCRLKSDALAAGFRLGCSCLAHIALSPIE